MISVQSQNLGESSKVKLQCWGGGGGLLDGSKPGMPGRGMLTLLKEKRKALAHLVLDLQEFGMSYQDKA